MRIILASGSPRRKELMEQLGFEFEIVKSNASEFVGSFDGPEDLVKQLAKKKALEVCERYPKDMVLGFDTLVFLNDKVYGKPQNEEECIQMIKELRDNTHLVVTGGYIKAPGYEDSFSTECKVHFKHISDEDIIEYAKTEEPYDKAGAYAIQGFIGRFIDSVDGDFFTVMGLPKAEVYTKITNYMRNIEK